jgi:2-haloalkanoic acid dehalogenase type II
MKAKVIFFDFWGTLVENGIFPSPSKQVKYILRIKEPFTDFIQKFEESFMTESFDNLTEGFDKVIKDFDLNPPDFVKDKLVGMWNKNTILAKPFPDTKDVLRALKEEGLKVALVSNADPFSIDQVIDKYGMKDLFDGIYLSYKYGKLKSHGDLFDIALKDLGFTKKDALMVGDSIESDIKGAEKAGIKSVLLDRKNKREYEDKIISLKELLE